MPRSNIRAFCNCRELETSSIATAAGGEAWSREPFTLSIRCRFTYGDSVADLPVASEAVRFPIAQFMPCCGVVCKDANTLHAKVRAGHGGNFLSGMHPVRALNSRRNSSYFARPHDSDLTPRSLLHLLFRSQPPIPNSVLYAKPKSSITLILSKDPYLPRLHLGL